MFTPSAVKIRDLIHKRKEVPFYNELDLLGIEDDILIGVSGKMTQGFKLKGISLSMKDKSEKASILSLAKKLLNDFCEGVSYQFFISQRIGDQETISQFQEAVIPKDKFGQQFLKAKIDALGKSIIQRKELILFITIGGNRSLSSKSSKNPFRIRRNYWRSLSRQTYFKTREDLNAAAQLVISGLKAIGVRAEQLNGMTIRKFLYESLNPSRRWILPPNGESIYNWQQKEAEPIIQAATLRSQLLFSPPVVGFDYFLLDGYYHQIINMLLPPESTDIKALKALIEKISFEYLLCLGIYVPDQQKALERLEIKANLSKSFSLLSTNKNYDAEAKYHELDALLTELKASSQKLFEVSLAVMVKKRNLEEVNKRAAIIQQAFRRFNNAEGISDHLNHDRLFLSFLPGHGERNHRSHLIQTNALAQILPIEGTWPGTKKPYLLLKTKENQLLKLDLFDAQLPAKHGLIFGTTGSGKSFFTNFLLAHFLISDPTHSVIIIDVGGSYRRLAQVFEGAYLDIDLSERYCLNPFPSKDKFFLDGKPNQDLLGFLTLLLEKFLREKNGLSPRDVRILEQAILEAYGKNSKNTAPLLMDVAKVLGEYPRGDTEDKSRAKWFSKNLALWTEGRFSCLFNRHGNIKVEKRLCMFDLQRLKEHPELQSIIFFVIRSVIAKKLFDLSIKKIIVIDEGWRFFQDEVGSLLIQDLYRTARKFNAMVLSISQSPEDFLSALAAPAIITNSYTKYILKLNKGHELLNQFDLNESEVEAVRNLVTLKGSYSELFIKFHTESVVAKLEPSPLDYWIATTDPADFKLEGIYQKKFPQLNTIEILRQLAKHYPKGAEGGGKNEKASH